MNLQGIIISQYMAGQQRLITSYNIFYYEKTSEEKPHTDTFKYINLEKGMLITDSISPDGNRYKIYKYKPNNLLNFLVPSNNSTKITLTPEKGYFEIFVFDKNFNGKIEFDESKPKKPTNYYSRSGWSNEIVVDKVEEMYIMVYFLPENYPIPEASNTKKYDGTYVLGATDAITPFILKEATPHKVTLDSNYTYTSQSYVYNHYNKTTPLFLSFNVFNSKIDIFVDFKPIIDTKLALLQKIGTVSLNKPFNLFLLTYLVNHIPKI